MSLLTVSLGYGKTASLELETFTRILRNEIKDDEELRSSKPDSLINGCEYVGLAKDGSLITDPVWSCVRRSWFNNKCIRVQFRDNVAWADRDAIGW